MIRANTAMPSFSLTEAKAQEKGRKLDSRFSSGHQIHQNHGQMVKEVRRRQKLGSKHAAADSMLSVLIFSC